MTEFESIKVRTQSHPNAFPYTPMIDKEEEEDKDSSSHLRDGATVGVL